MTNYEVYHKTFTSCIDEVISYLKKQGLYLDSEEVFTQITTGRGRPKHGDTHSYNLFLYTQDGIPAKAMVHFQIADLGNRYELNMYTSKAKLSDYPYGEVTIQESFKGLKNMKRMKEEEIDVEKVIKDLAKSYGDSNEDQGKMVNLMKGLAFSDEPEANKFMKALDKWTTEYANKNVKESITENQDFSKGDKVKTKFGLGTVVGVEDTTPPMVKVKCDDGKEKVFRKRELTKVEEKMVKQNTIEIQEEVKIGNIILEKGDKIEVLKEDYGWEIQRGKEWDAFEDAMDNFGAEEIAVSLAQAMGDKDLGENLSFMFRNWEYDSPYLK